MSFETVNRKEQNCTSCSDEKKLLTKRSILNPYPNHSYCNFGSPFARALSGILVVFLVYILIHVSARSSIFDRVFSCAEINSRAGSGKTYKNPILNEGADPYVCNTLQRMLEALIYYRWVLRHDGYYYMTYTTNNDIVLFRSKKLTDWKKADKKTIFQPPAGLNYSTDLWAPEVKHPSPLHPYI